MQKNLIYLSGPHGSGKTTLGEEIATENPDIIIPKLYSRTVKLNTTTHLRQMLKAGARAVENFEYKCIAEENPDKIIIGNRCIYDMKAYNQVCLRMGWISKKDYQLIESYIGGLFFGQESPLAIVLNPGIDVVARHIRERWKKEDPKWREEDFGYARMTCEVYESFKGCENILYIDREIDLESRCEINSAREWIKRVTGMGEKRFSQGLGEGDCAVPA